MGTRCLCITRRHPPLGNIHNLAGLLGCSTLPLHWSYCCLPDTASADSINEAKNPTNLPDRRADRNRTCRSDCIAARTSTDCLGRSNDSTPLHHHSRKHPSPLHGRHKPLHLLETILPPATSPNNGASKRARELREGCSLQDPARISRIISRASARPGA